MNSHPSSSSAQLDAEGYILNELEKRLSLSFDIDASLPVNLNVKPDAIDLKNKVIVEVYARVGSIKGAQNNKVKGDILKLALLDKELGKTWRKILCFGSEEAAKYVMGKSWVAAAAKVFNVEVQVIPLSEGQKRNVLAAQKRQRMVNSE